MRTAACLLAGAAVLASLVGATEFSAWAHPRRHRQAHRRGTVRFQVVVVPARPVARPLVVAGRTVGVVDFHVEPPDTEVIVDGTYRGRVDDLDGWPAKLYLYPGKHRIRLRTPWGATWSERVRILAGHEVELKVALED